MKNQKMKIAVDIDEVLFEFIRGYLKYLERKGYENISFEKIIEYPIAPLLGISLEQDFSMADEFYFSGDFEKCELVGGAKEGIASLKDFELYIITNRPISWKEKTVRFLRENFNIDGSKVYFIRDFLGKVKNKAEVCEELGIEVLIEDQKSFCLECAKNGINVLMLDKPWNKGISHENIIRCFSWQDILEKLGGMKNDIETPEL